jgi:hypothetical protein
MWKTLGKWLAKTLTQAALERLIKGAREGSIDKASQ